MPTTIIARETCKKKKVQCSLILKTDGSIAVIKKSDEKDWWAKNITGDCHTRFCPRKHYKILVAKAKGHEEFKAKLLDVQVTRKLDDKKLWLFRYENGDTLQCSGTDKQKLCQKLGISSAKNREEFLKSLGFISDTRPDNPVSLEAPAVGEDTEMEDAPCDAREKGSSVSVDSAATSTRRTTSKHSTTTRDTPPRPPQRSTTWTQEQQEGPSAAPPIIIGHETGRKNTWHLILEGNGKIAVKDATETKDWPTRFQNGCETTFFPQDHHTKLLEMASKGQETFKKGLMDVQLSNRFDGRTLWRFTYMDGGSLNCEGSKHKLLCKKLKIKTFRELQKFNDCPQAGGDNVEVRNYDDDDRGRLSDHISRRKSRRTSRRKSKVIVGKLSSETGDYVLIEEGTRLRIEESCGYSENQLRKVKEGFYPDDHAATLRGIIGNAKHDKSKIHEILTGHHAANNYDNDNDCYYFYVKDYEKPLRCSFDIASEIMEICDNCIEFSQLQEFLGKDMSLNAPKQKRSRTNGTVARKQNSKPAVKLLCSEKLDKVPREKSTKKCVIYDPNNEDDSYILLTWEKALNAYSDLEISALDKKSSLTGKGNEIVKKLKKSYEAKKLLDGTIRKVVATLFYACAPYGRYYVIYEVVSSQARKSLNLSIEDRFQLCSRGAYFISKSNKKEKDEVKGRLTKTAEAELDHYERSMTKFREDLGGE